MVSDLHYLSLIQQFLTHSQVIKWTIISKVHKYLGYIQYPKFIKFIQNFPQKLNFESKVGFFFLRFFFFFHFHTLPLDSGIVLWFYIDRLSVCGTSVCPSIFLFPDDNLSKY